MLCSHGLPYECRCPHCAQEAMERVRNQANLLPPTQHDVPKAVREQFWAEIYRQGVDKPVY